MIYCCRCWWKTTHAHAQNWRHYRCIRWFARENARDWQNTKEQLDDLWTSAWFSAWNPIPIGDQSPRNIQTQFTNLSWNSNDQNCSLIDRSGSPRMSSSGRQLRQFQVPKKIEKFWKKLVLKISMNFFRDREEILSKSKLLRGSNVYITEDLSRKLREHRNELTKFMREVSLILANNHK